MPHQHFLKSKEARSRGTRRAVLPTLVAIGRHRRFKDCGDSARPTGKEHRRVHLMTPSDSTLSCVDMIY